MKKNRGVTILEILISVILISIIVVLLFSLLNEVREDDLKAGIQSNFIIIQSTFEKAIEEDIIDHGVVGIDSCELSDFNKDSSTINGELPRRCVKITYDTDYLDDNLAYLGIYNYYTRYGQDYCGNGIDACEPKWVIVYERGQYETYKNGKPLTSSWKATSTTMHEFTTDVDLTDVPYLYYTASIASNSLNGASLVVPIVDMEGHHYDINASFTYTINSGSDAKNINFVCDADHLMCDCQYSNITGGCDSIITGEQTKVNTDSSLTEIKVKDQLGNSILVPNFNSNMLNYSYINVPFGTTMVNIVPVLSNSRSSYVIKGGTDIKVGNNEKKIIVTAEDGTSTVYTLNFIRTKDTSAALKSLSLSNGTINFSQEVTNYNVSVSSGTQYVYINCEATSKLAHVQGCNLGVNLGYGHNKQNIIVTAEDGVTKKVYQVDIFREYSSDVSLKNINASKGILLFKDNNMYELHLNESTFVDITAEPNSSNAIVSGNQNYDIDKDQVIVIFVTSLDGNEETYFIYVYIDDFSLSNLSTVIDGKHKLQVINGNIKMASPQNFVVDLDKGKKSVTLLIDEVPYLFDLSAHDEEAYSTLKIIDEKYSDGIKEIEYNFTFKLS